MGFTANTTRPLAGVFKAGVRIGLWMAEDVASSDFKTGCFLFLGVNELFVNFPFLLKMILLFYPLLAETGGASAAAEPWCTVMFMLMGLEFDLRNSCC